jgi:N6-L-threonylcarbamoyladenine synthase
MLERGESPADVAAYCLFYLEAVLAEMTRRARETYPDLRVVYAGGVMSHASIQNGLKKRFDNCFFAPPAFSADNAAGIAVLCARSSS